MRSPLHFAPAVFVILVFGSPACLLNTQGTEFTGAASGTGGAGGEGGGGVGGEGGSAGGGAGGSGGAPIMCTPGVVEPCYSGPKGTKDVGSCEGGMRTCNSAGDGFSACDGEVTPIVEDCSTLGDEDCDGSIECACDAAWETVFGAAGNDEITDVATDSAGNVIFVARFNGMVTVAPGVMYTSKGAVDVLVGKLDAAGKHVWSKQIGGSGADRPFAVAVTGVGEVIVGGLFEAAVDFGGGQVMADGGSAAFVLRLNSAGNFTNVAVLSGTGSESLSDIALDSVGNAYAVGWYEGVLTAGVHTANGLGPDGYVTMITPSATFQWLKNVSGSGLQRVNGVAVDGSNNVYITGLYENTIELGSGPLISQGGFDALVAQLAPESGKANWSKSFGGPGSQVGVRVGVAGSDVVVGGEFDGVIGVGSTILTELSAGDDLFLTKLAASGMGTPGWVRQFGSTEDDRLGDMAIETGSNVLLAGTFQKSISFAGPALVSSGGEDAFFARLSVAGGDHLCSRSFGGSAGQGGKAVAAGAAGAAYLGGDFAGSVKFVMQGHDSPGANDFDAFLLQINP